VKSNKQILAAFLGAITLLTIGAVSLVSTGCGTSDSIQSITLSSTGSSAGGFFNLAGVDGTQQLTVTANYHSGKTIDVTQDSTYSVVPVGTQDDMVSALPPYGPDTVPISKSGLMTGIAQICTWTDAIDPTTGKPFAPPVWEYTGYYQVTATYREFTSQPVGMGVGVTASLNAPGCGPS
jgi:hypothetical protein